MLNRLAVFRERRGLSQGDLAEELSVSKQTVVAIEKGKYDPSLPLAGEIARFFRVAIEDIFPARTEDVVPAVATFVMTDIVGSTALATGLGERYVDVLRRHRELLVDVFTRHGGRVVDDTGDATFAVFEESGQAIHAALDAHRTIAVEPWPGSADVRIRVGIHTGEAYAVGNRFVGLAVHEAARICSTAQAGQILVSESTAMAQGDRASLADSSHHDLPGVGRRRLFLIGGDTG